MNAPTRTAAALVLGLCLLAGCGSAGTDESNATGGTAASIVFPPPNAYTLGETIMVRGVVDDATDVTGVTIAGTPAVSDDGFATWTAEAPLANVLTVRVSTPAGSEEGEARAVTREEPDIAGYPGAPRAYDPGAGLIYELNESDDLISIATTTGARRFVLRRARDTFQGDESMAVDPATGLLYVMDTPGLGVRIQVVNPTDGTAQLLSMSGDAQGPDFPERGSRDQQLLFDPVGQRLIALFHDNAANILVAFAVTLDSGVRALLATGSERPGDILAAALRPGTSQILIREDGNVAYIGTSGVSVDHGVMPSIS